MPKRCEIELSSACNLHCTYCPRRFVDDISGFMEFELYKKIIDELSPFPETIIVLHRRGESLLHPEIGRCLDYIRGKFADIQLATNATLLDSSISEKIMEAVTFISFSIDAPVNFNRTRTPASYEEVERKILNFLSLNRGRTRTQVSMVATAGTSPESIDEFKERWLGKVDRVRIYEEHSTNGRFGSLARRRDNRVSCVMPFYELLVYADGKVGRCNHDWAGEPLGDLNGSSIRDIWHSSVYEDLREQHRTLNFRDRVCAECDSWYPVVGSQMTGEVYGAAS